MKFSGAIIDLDGTLLDSMSIWDTIAEDYLVSLGITPTENLSDVMWSMSVEEAAGYLKTNYLPQLDRRQIIDGVQGILSDFYREHAQLKPGAQKLLEKLSGLKVRCCVATTTSKELAKAALKRCGVLEYFEFIITCFDVGSSKSRPDIYEQALARLGSERSSTLVMEDAAFALNTAKKAGYFSVGIRDRYDRGKPARCGIDCDIIIDSLEEMEQYLDE